jgi:hypothetical protein
MPSPLRCTPSGLSFGAFQARSSSRRREQAFKLLPGCLMYSTRAIGIVPAVLPFSAWCHLMRIVLSRTNKLTIRNFFGLIMFYAGNKILLPTLN